MKEELYRILRYLEDGPRDLELFRNQFGWHATISRPGSANIHTGGRPTPLLALSDLAKQLEDASDENRSR